MVDSYPSASSGGGNSTAKYVLQATDATLPNSFVVTAGSNITLVPAGSTLTINASGGSGPTTNQLTDTVRVTLDGGGAAVAVSTAIDIVIDYACTIQQVTMLADFSTTSVIDIYKVAFSTTYAPTSANSICASAKPTLTAAKGSRDSTLTGWTTAVSAGDVLRVIVNSNNVATRITIGLKVLKT